VYSSNVWLVPSLAQYAIDRIGNLYLSLKDVKLITTTLYIILIAASNSE